MARNATLDTRSVRRRLKQIREPHWRTLSKKKGWAIGYRKGTKGGSWIAKHYNKEHGRRYKSLGKADDDPDVTGVLNYDEAEEKAKAWFKELIAQDASGTDTGTYTVEKAITDYMADYRDRGGKAASRIQNNIDGHILSPLGTIEVRDLTTDRVEKWHRLLARTPARVRTRKGEIQQYRDLIDDPEVHRKRRATSNKVLTILKAALNFANRTRHFQNADAWREVKPFQNVDAPKVRFLSDDESTRLVNACRPDLRTIVTAALLTGCRYGELTVMKAQDLNQDADNPHVHIPVSKGGRTRNVFLTPEGFDFFKRAVAGKAGDQLLFNRENGNPWKASDQARPMKEACEGAKISPPISFHILRHCYGSRLAMKSVPMAVIAAQLGHADTRICEKHYAHLGPSYIADTVRAAFGELGIVEKDNVTALK
jgi:integrase